MDLINNSQYTIIFLTLASIRIYLEIIKFKFSELPLTKKLSQKSSQNQLEKFHRSGFYFSVGYIVFFAPQILFS